MVRNRRFRNSLQLQSLDRRDLPSAVLPFADGFESGVLGANWGQSGTNNGSVSVTGGFSPITGSKQVLVGPSASGINSRSELILHVDLGGIQNANFTFKAKEFNDVDHPMPASFVGTSNTDGVALSVDGANWYRIVSLTGTASQNTAQVYTYNLGKIAADHGLSLTGDTMIKFQNYGASAPTNGGFAFDDISISIAGNVNGIVYEDANLDGAYQAGEALSSGHKIYLDSNNDGRLNVGTETVVFSEQLPAPILDAKRALYPMLVTGVGNPTIGDIDVNIALAHTYVGDLDITLIAPDGRRVLLTSDNGGSGDNYYITKFDDDAATAITAGTAPFSGTFRPEGKLSDLNGAAMYGWWYLEIVDDAASDVGTLGGWSLDLGRLYKTVVNKPISESSVLYTDVLVDDVSYDDLDVVVNIDHPNVGDLSILLATPNNNWVYLAENDGGTGNNFTNTRFNDEASVAISAGSAPFTGHFKPQDKLSTLENYGWFSQYELRISDDVAGNVGMLKDFSVILTETWTAGAQPVVASNPGNADRYATFQVDHVGGPIVDIDVLVDVDHYNNAVLNLELTGEDNGAKVTLTGGNSLDGASGQDFHSTTFDDEASVKVIGGTGPYAGAFRPAQSLSKFDGLSPDGAWKLKVDNTKLAGGELNWAGLVIRTADVARSITVQSINDQATMTSNLNVGNVTGALADLDVQISIVHSYVADLDVYLTAPNGKIVELFTDVGSNGDNLNGAILDDEATTGIAAGTAPFVGTFRPEGSLADFDGMDPNGIWTLTITDDASGDTGLLTAWSLIMTTGERFDVTDAAGAYEFANIAPGSFAIRADKNAGIDWTNPNSGRYDEVMTFGGSSTSRDFGYVSDNQAPNAAFIDLMPSVLNVAVDSVDVVFSEPVTGVDLTDFGLFTINNTPIDLVGATLTTLDNITWTIGNLAGLNSISQSYHIDLQSVGSGIMDMAMNPMASFTNPSEFWIVDKIAPVIVDLTRDDPAVTNLTTVSWKYVYSENVVGMSPANFQLTGSAAVGAQIVSVGSGHVTAYVINNGTLGITMTNSMGTNDIAGNPVSNLPFPGESYTIARPLLHPQSIQVNDGAVQRSRVSSLTVTFDGVPAFATTPANAFQMKRQSDGAVVPLIVDVNGVAVTLTFGGMTEFGSLVDGRYNLTILGSQIGNFDPDNNGVVGEDHVFNFHRLFGDGNGDAKVNAGDFSAFRSVFGLAGASAFDFHNDNSVLSADFTQFRARFGLSV